MHLSTVKMPIDLGRDKPSASLSILIVKYNFLTCLRCFCITFSATVRKSWWDNRWLPIEWFPLLIMLTEPTFCRNSSINIPIDNRYDNRFIHLGRPIFTVNHNGACVYNSDYTLDRACTCYTREAPLFQYANWVSDHRYSTARFSYCSINPLRVQ